MQTLNISITQQISKKIIVNVLQIIIIQEPFIIKYFDIDDENFSLLLKDNERKI